MDVIISDVFVDDAVSVVAGMGIGMIKGVVDVCDCGGDGDDDDDDDGDDNLVDGGFCATLAKINYE